MCGTRVHVNYHGQPKTCFKCGKTVHLGADCTQLKSAEPKFPGKWAGPRRSDPSTLNQEEFPALHDVATAKALEPAVSNMAR